MYAPFIGCGFQNFTLERKNKMLAKRWFPALTKQQISELRGGQKHNFKYFVGISEIPESEVLTNIMELKLKNQMGSQRSVFPEGYEPFQASYGTARLCLNTMTIPAPRLKLYPWGWPHPILMPQIVLDRKVACVLIPGWRTEAFHILKAEAEVFEIKHRIRRHAAKSHATLDLALSLMAYGGSIPLSSNLDDRFEAYLCLRSPEFLRDLLARIDMPGSPQGPIAPELPQAA
jgi:hypothetical protein